MGLADLFRKKGSAAASTPQKRRSQSMKEPQPSTDGPRASSSPSSGAGGRRELPVVASSLSYSDTAAFLGASDSSTNHTFGNGSSSLSLMDDILGSFDLAMSPTSTSHSSNAINGSRANDSTSSSSRAYNNSSSHNSNTALSTAASYTTGGSTAKVYRLGGVSNGGSGGVAGDIRPYEPNFLDSHDSDGSISASDIRRILTAEKSGGNGRVLSTPASANGRNASLSKGPESGVLAGPPPPPAGKFNRSAKRSETDLNRSNNSDNDPQILLRSRSSSGAKAPPTSATKSNKAPLGGVPARSSSVRQAVAPRHAARANSSGSSESESDDISDDDRPLSSPRSVSRSNSLVPGSDRQQYGEGGLEGWIQSVAKTDDTIRPGNLARASSPLQNGRRDVGGQAGSSSGKAAAPSDVSASTASASTVSSHSNSGQLHQNSGRPASIILPNPSTPPHSRPSSIHAPELTRSLSSSALHSASGGPNGAHSPRSLSRQPSLQSLRSNSSNHSQSRASDFKAGAPPSTEVSAQQQMMMLMMANPMVIMTPQYQAAMSAMSPAQQQQFMVAYLAQAAQQQQLQQQQQQQQVLALLQAAAVQQQQLGIVAAAAASGGAGTKKKDKKKKKPSTKRSAKPATDGEVASEDVDQEGVDEEAVSVADGPEVLEPVS